MTAPTDTPEARSKFLLNGTRFKFSFIDHDCPQCGEFVGKFPNCLQGWEKELDQRWVAFVPAEDDRHLAASAASLVAEPVAMREALESIATMVALLPDGSETITEAAILKRARRALGAA